MCVVIPLCAETLKKTRWKIGSAWVLLEQRMKRTDGRPAHLPSATVAGRTHRNAPTPRSTWRVSDLCRTRSWLLCPLTRSWLGEVTHPVRVQMQVFGSKASQVLSYLLSSTFYPLPFKGIHIFHFPIHHPVEIHAVYFLSFQEGDQSLLLISSGQVAGLNFKKYQNQKISVPCQLPV